MKRQMPPRLGLLFAAVWLPMAGFGQADYTPYTFTTLAGDASITDAQGNPVGGYADGSGKAARFNYPLGVAVDNAGNVYVADTENEAIRVITADGIVSTLAGDPSIVDAQGMPVSGYADGQGRSARFFNPSDIACDNARNIYVADSGNGVIRKITRNGIVTTFVGSPGVRGTKDGVGTAAQLTEPYGLAIDRSDNLYVADDDRIRKITPEGIVTTTWINTGHPWNLVWLTRVAVDRESNYYISGSAGTGLVEVKSDGSIISLLDGCTGPFVGVTVGADDNVYIGYFHQTILRMSASGLMTTLAGNYAPLGCMGVGGYQDGTGIAARFSRPCALALDASGNIYVADCCNHAIRKGWPAKGAPRSLAFSTVSVSPGSALADGKSPVAVTVTLLDENAQPMPAKIVQVTTQGDAATGMTVTQSAGLTDVNGHATATLTSTKSGTVLIVVTDITDGMSLSAQFQQPTVAFTPYVVPPSPKFMQDIHDATTWTGEMLTQDANCVAKIAVDEGEIGDYFKGQVTAEAEKAVVDTVFFGAGLAAEAILPELKAIQKLFVGLGETADNILWDNVADLMHDQANKPTGMISVGQGIATMSRQQAAELAAQAQPLLSGIPLSSAGQAGDLNDDLSRRKLASQVLLQALQAQDVMLQTMRATFETGDGGLGDAIGISLVVAGALLPPPADLVVEWVAFDEAIFQRYQAQRAALEGNQTAWSSLVTCSQFGARIYQNTADYFKEVAQGVAPNPVNGSVVMVANTGIWVLQHDLNSPAWLEQTADSTPAYLDTYTSASTLVNVKNTGNEAAVFEAFAFYQPDTTIVPAGKRVLVTATKTLSPGGSDQLELVYYDHDSKKGAVPAVGSSIDISVLAWNDRGAFYIGSGDSPIQLNLTPAPHPQGRRGVAPAGGESGTNAVFIYDPLDCQIAPNQTNWSYNAVIHVRNPFLLPLLATVTQPFPSGVTVLATDGASGNSSITWTNTIPSNGLAFGSFSFSLSTTPGAATNLPAPTVVFSEPSTTNSLALESVAPSFNGLFPVKVSGSVPLGTPGTNAIMLVTVTNLTAVDQTGALTLALTNTALALVTNLTQTFAIPAAGGTNLSFFLPGDVPAGQYAVTGLLSINGGGGQVLAGIYTMPGPRVTLDVGPAPIWSTNGLSLALDGPLGSNYLVQASTDLVNWTPIRYFGITNSPFYFNDAAATNSGARFYRAVMP